MLQVKSCLEQSQFSDCMMRIAYQKSEVVVSWRSHIVFLVFGALLLCCSNLSQFVRNLEQFVLGSEECMHGTECVHESHLCVCMLILMLMKMMITILTIIMMMMLLLLEDEKHKR